MTIHVPENMLKTVASKQLSPVDIVMGDHWGEIVLGNPQRLSLLNYIFRQLQESRRGSSSVSKARRRPQSLVKVLRTGGTTNVTGMRAQMRYLEKGGDADLELSDLYFGAKLEGAEKEALIESWDITGYQKGGFDKTKHIIVSFPPGTDKGAAYRSGRAWVSEMFASGKYGDVYDYYTAFHTDQAHPHMHIVVHRRGMEHGVWLSIHKEGAFNYDTFRQVQVEVSALEGIELGASSRHARGLTDRPVPDAEIRAAEKEGRKPVAPSHTPVTALKAVASIALYSSQLTTDANLLRRNHPELAQTMREMAGTILQGREVKTDPNQKTTLTLEEAKKQSEFIMSRRQEILAGIKEIDAEISTIPIGKERSQLEQDASKIKAETAKVIPDAAELIGHTEVNREGYYSGIKARDGIEQAIKLDADNKVADLAKANGVDPVKLVSRYDRTDPASVALSQTWRKDELEDIQKNLTYREPLSQNNSDQLAQVAYDDLHRNALQTYRAAERELDAQAARKRELYRIAKLIREGRRLDETREAYLRDTVRKTLTPPELRELEAGNSRVLRFVTPDADQQRVLSRRYLEAEQLDADGGRKLQLSTALARIDRDAELATQRAAEAVKKDRGLDR